MCAESALWRMVSPAHAGIDRETLDFYIRQICFPRPRGDRPRNALQSPALFPFPPPTRG